MIRTRPAIQVLSLLVGGLWGCTGSAVLPSLSYVPLTMGSTLTYINEKAVLLSYRLEGGPQIQGEGTYRYPMPGGESWLVYSGAGSHLYARQVAYPAEKSQVIFDRPVLWLLNGLRTGETQNETVGFTRYDAIGGQQRGTYERAQNLLGFADVQVPAGTYTHCALVEVLETWTWADQSQTQRRSVLVLAEGVGPVRVSQTTTQRHPDGRSASTRTTLALQTQSNP